MTEGYYWAKSALDQRVVVVEKDTDGTHYFIPGNKFPYNQSHFEWISEIEIKPIAEKETIRRKHMLHHVEVFQKEFKEILSGRTVAVHFNSNRFMIKDKIEYMERKLTEYKGDFTGNTCMVEVVSIIENQLGIELNFCALGIKLI